MNDKSRPLQIPTWQIPYMEKHRLYELYHELTRELVLHQPEDHVAFIKQILFNTCQARNTSRVVMICPTKTNCDLLAYKVARLTNQVVITKKRIEECAGVSPVRSAEMIQTIRKLIRKDDAFQRGWILVNCLKTEDEAKELLKIGILPTHCLYLVSPFYPPVDEPRYHDVPHLWPEYRRRLIGLREVFKAIWSEVHIEEMKSEKVAALCASMIKKKDRKAAMIPRLVLIGPRGSGRRTQAKLLFELINMVHIDFRYLLCQYCKMDSELGKKVRELGDEVCFNSELMVMLINERVLKTDCLTYGWVLTGFPFTKTDLMYLDCIDTPPNRIIFLECDLRICLERVMNSTHSEKETKEMINVEHNYYCDKYPDIKEYCGESASVINADQKERWVHENILGVMQSEAPPVLRKPFEGETVPPGTSTTSAFDKCKCGPFPTHIKDMFITKL